MAAADEMGDRAARSTASAVSLVNVASPHSSGGYVEIKRGRTACIHHLLLWARAFLSYESHSAIGQGVVHGRFGGRLSRKTMSALKPSLPPPGDAVRRLGVPDLRPHKCEFRTK